MLEALPAVRAAQEGAGERGHDAPADRWQAWLEWRSGFGRGAGAFPPEPQVLQEGEGELAQQGVVVQAAPGAALEVVEAQLAPSSAGASARTPSAP
jgi:hypothetical protein